MEQTVIVMRARPIIAGLLNTALPGVGYIFIGKRKIFGWMLFIATLFSLAARNYGFKASEFMAGHRWASTFEIVSIILITVSFGVDAYLEAREK